MNLVELIIFCVLTTVIRKIAILLSALTGITVYLTIPVVIWSVVGMVELASILRRLQPRKYRGRARSERNKRNLMILLMTVLMVAAQWLLSALQVNSPGKEAFGLYSAFVATLLFGLVAPALSFLRCIKNKAKPKNPPAEPIDP